MRRSHLPVESVLAVDDLKLDRVERAGRRIELTSKEFCLLEYLMRNAERRITRAMIIEHVWNLSFDTCANVVDVDVNYLRRKVISFLTRWHEIGACPISPKRGFRRHRVVRGFGRRPHDRRGQSGGQQAAGRRRA
jgi:DNA-binding winged helix-turn-helix (wHTH) protein